MSHPIKLTIVIPCYNEQEVLPETWRRLSVVIDRLISTGKISWDSSVLFVDDGSKDLTWALIEQLATTNLHVTGIKCSRNRGHQNALIAGLFTADGDAIVSIDADLQDDINAIESMKVWWTTLSPALRSSMAFASGATPIPGSRR